MTICSDSFNDHADCINRTVAFMKIMLVGSYFRTLNVLDVIYIRVEY